MTISHDITLYVRERATGKVFEVWNYEGKDGGCANYACVKFAKNHSKVFILGETCDWCIPSGPDGIFVLMAAKRYQVTDYELGDGHQKVKLIGKGNDIFEIGKDCFLIQ